MTSQHNRTTPVPEWVRERLARQEAARIATEQPAAVAAYLRAMLTASTEVVTVPAHGVYGNDMHVVTVDRIRQHLTALTEQADAANLATHLRTCNLSAATCPQCAPLENEPF